MANLSASLSVDDRFKYHGSLLVPMVSLHQCLHTCVRLCMMHINYYVCAHASLLFVHASVYVWVYVCMHLCVYVQFVCVCVCVCMRVYVNTDSAINAY